MLSLLPYLILLLELVGLFLVAREVYRGQEAEMAAGGLAVGRRLVDLHEKAKYADFLRELWVSTGSTEDAAKGWIEALPPANLKENADTLVPVIKRAIARWDRYTVGAWHKLRRRDLMLGTLSLMTAAALRVVEALLRQGP
jgi:hypothetical protein